MILRRTILSGVLVVCFCVNTRAGPVTMFTDFDAFLAAAGDVREIDFETLPDGSPSMDAVQITPEFNYTDQGVDFFSHVPELFITGSPISEFNLKAGQQGSGGPRNWIIAELITPATAVAVLFPGGTTVSIFDTAGGLIASERFASLHQFGGYVSDVPIASVVVDRGIEVQSIESFLFTPIPEPATLFLIISGTLILLPRRLVVRRVRTTDVLGR